MFYSKWGVYQKLYLDLWVRPKLLNTYLEQIKTREKPLFIHINRTAGSSIANSLEITEAHHTFSAYKKLYQKKFNESFPEDLEVWTAIRNPFDKVVSEYYYRIQTNQNKMKTHPISFDDWVKKVFLEKDVAYRDREIMFIPQSEWLVGAEAYSLNIIKFESLQKDYKTLATKFSAKPLVWKKKTENFNYKVEFSEVSKKIISDVFKEDLDRFGYFF